MLFSYKIEISHKMHIFYNQEKHHKSSKKTHIQIFIISFIIAKIQEKQISIHTKVDKEVVCITRNTTQQ